MANACAVEFGLNVISCKGPELLNKYIGSSEKAVRDLFERASRIAPCLLFFDEFESIVPRRNSGSTGVTDRVVNQFLTYLDGVSSLKGCYIIAATSRPDLIDPALLRPGRIDRHIFCSLPDEDARSSFIDFLMTKINVKSFDKESFVKMTEGYSTAEIKAAFQNAHLKKLNEVRVLSEKAPEIDLGIQYEELLGSLREVNPFSKTSEFQKAQKIYENFGKGKIAEDVSKPKTILK